MYQQFRWTKIADARNAILRDYEPLQPYVLIEFGKLIQADVFIDIGANIGAYSMFFSSLPSIQNIYAFEPSPRTRDELLLNVKLNGLSDKIKIFDSALSDQRTTVKFGIVNDYSGANSIVGTSIHESAKFLSQVDIACAPLDSIFQEKNRKLCMKIDVEGHEKEVVLGSLTTLKQNRVVIQLEKYLENDNSVSEVLSEVNYRQIFSIGPDCYFTNAGDSISEKNIISVFEKAAENLIKSNFQPRLDDAPIRIEPLRGIAFEISGRLAKMARHVKQGRWAS